MYVYGTLKNQTLFIATPYSSGQHCTVQKVNNTMDSRHGQCSKLLVSQISKEPTR